MRPVPGVEARRGSALDPANEKYLLELHAAMDLDSFWKSTQRLLSATLPNQLIGLTLRHDPVLPLTERWSLPMPTGLFGTRPLKQRIAVHPSKKFVRVADLFSNRQAFARSTIYRRYLAPQNCAHAICILFWQRRRLVCAMVILRTAVHGYPSPAEMNLLRQLYPRFAVTLRRLSALERERAIRIDLEEFVRRLPLPTILLRWNLKLLFQNPAARDFCAVWEKGAETARVMKSTATIPPEILGGCRRLQRQWRRRRRSELELRKSQVVQVQHPRSPNLRATIQLKQINDAVAHPHFLIECEDLRRLEDRNPSVDSRLSQLVQLTGRQQEIAQLVCNGQSNQEIADTAHLTLPTVKKHLHTVYRKLEVSSRAQLMALLL